MKSVQIVTGTGVPLKRSDVDTDQIIPAVWLKQVERTGFEKGLFSKPVRATCLSQTAGMTWSVSTSVRFRGPPVPATI